MSSYVGIDLGTAFSAVATVDSTGRPVIVENRGERLLPSCVFIKDDKMYVGERARKSLWFSPHAVGRFKPDMGTSKTYKVGSETYTPTELSAAVLGELKKIAVENIGEIAEAVITIPANFSHDARQATMEAAHKVGLNVKYIINEPTAAALYYAFKHGERLLGNYVVYDLGGGTFDVSILRVDGHDVNVLATHGISRLGGDDFDRALQALVARKYKEETEEELDNKLYTLNEAEEDKKSLSLRRSVLAGGGDGVGEEVFDIKRSEFEDAIATLLVRTQTACEIALREASLETVDIRGVFLAGGSTKIPMVREVVRRAFKQEPKAAENVDEVVALGASLYAAFKSDGTYLTSAQKQSIRKIQITEATSKFFGIVALDLNERTGREEERNSILITKGQKIPCSVTSLFSTVYDNQTVVNCKITESGAPETNLGAVKVIREYKFPLPEGRPKGQGIEVTFGYDENQIMTCSFKDVSSGMEADISIHISEAQSHKRISNIDKFLSMQDSRKS